MDNVYIDVTKENHATCRTEMHDVFLSQEDFSKNITRAVNAYCKEKGILFLDKMTILTEPLSPLAKEAVEKKCKKLGLRATVKNDTTQGKYLYSNGGGHYSTDYYEVFHYGLITIVG